MTTATSQSGRRQGLRHIGAPAAAALLALSAHTDLRAQDWIEVKSPHFTIVSNAGQSNARTLAWQLEQVRAAITSLFAWVRADPDPALLVLAVKDESSMKALAPQYWERPGGIRPVSVWVSSPDQHYLAIRADVRGEDRNNLNPHANAYFAYLSLTLQQSANRELPWWFLRGFAGVLSNTIVRKDFVAIGHFIPWHLDRLRDGSRLTLSALTNITRASPELADNEKLNRFDAQSWAFVHFLMFADNGLRRPKLEKFVSLISQGSDSDAALREALGSVETLESEFVYYLNKELFTYLRYNLDATISREGFAARPLAAFESASTRALFHAAMGRNADARALIDEARKTRPDAPETFLVEGLLADREGKEDVAREAFTKAVNGGSTSGYAHFRLAALLWTSQPAADAVATIEKLLLRAVTLNNRDARSYAFLGNVRSLSGGEGLPFVRRAISLAPTEASYRLVAARILLRKKAFDDALAEARSALSLARGDDDRRSANALLESIEQARSQGGTPPRL